MEILKSINWIDILVVIIVMRISYVAFSEGLSHEIFPFITALASVIFCLHYYDKIGSFLCQNFLKIPIDICNFVSFLALAVGTGYLFKLVRVILDKIIKVQWNPLIERSGGFIFGVARSFVIASLVLMTMVLLPLPYLQWSIRDKSLTGMHILRVGPEIYEKASRLLPAIRMGGSPVSKEALVKALASDKSIAPAETSKKKKTAEWEKVQQ
ncbi:MAG: CvpA family protein [Candidatus Omnitrophota bacterium]